MEHDFYSFQKKMALCSPKGMAMPTRFSVESSSNNSTDHWIFAHFQKFPNTFILNILQFNAYEDLNKIHLSDH